MFITQMESEEKIRKILKDADKIGKLNVVASITGIAGGTKRLREIMNSSGEMSVMDRGMLTIHLDT